MNDLHPESNSLKAPVSAVRKVLDNEETIFQNTRVQVDKGLPSPALFHCICWSAS